MKISWTLLASTACTALQLGAIGCSDSKGSATNKVPVGTVDAGGQKGLSATARQELLDTHVNKYVGKAAPSGHVQADDTTVYKFDPADGPLCLRGAPYQAMIRDEGSEDLVIYLEGGGACWSGSTGFCAANETATSLNTGTVPKVGVLDDTDTANVVAKWNVVYAPYCDGSVFSGDNDVANPDGGDRPTYHRGLRNLSAVLDLAKAQYPNPKRVLLAGSSAGGYGTLAATGLVLLQYPNADVMVFNDSGLGLSNPADPEMFQQIEADWKIQQLIPPSCTDCATGELSALITWGLKADSALRVAAFSSYEDSVIGGVFLKMAGPDFKKLVLTETDKIHDAYPDRFKRLMINGGQHTTLLAGYKTTEVDGTTAAEFTNAFVNESAAWKDLLAAHDGG